MTRVICCFLGPCLEWMSNSQQIQFTTDFLTRCLIHLFAIVNDYNLSRLYRKTICQQRVVVIYTSKNRTFVNMVTYLTLCFCSEVNFTREWFSIFEVNIVIWDLITRNSVFRRRPLLNLWTRQRIWRNLNNSQQKVKIQLIRCLI